MNERQVLIRGGVIVDAQGLRREDLRIRAGRIVDTAPQIPLEAADELIEASGSVVMPALADPHTHLRVPGDEEAETLVTGTMAGALGGYGALLAMPNTRPALDGPSSVRQLLTAAQKMPVHVLAAGTITKDRQGKELSPFAGLRSAGVRIVTDDGSGVQDANIMRRALQYCDELGLIVAQHAEDASLFAYGVMNEGPLSSNLGLAGIPAAAEEVMVARDIELARSTGAHVHFLHLSTVRSAQLVARAKRDGIAVTAEVTPHHLIMQDALLQGYDPLFKVNPPLRAEADRAGLWEYVAEGVFDVVGTDHAPHATWKKDAPLDSAAFGMLGLQHALAAMWTGALACVDRGLAPAVPSEIAAAAALAARAEPWLSEAEGCWLWRLASMMSWKPAALIGAAELASGTLRTGDMGSVVIFDPAHRWSPRADSIVSKAGNSPWLGRELIGKVSDLFIAGRRLVADGQLVLEGNWQ